MGVGWPGSEQVLWWSHKSNWEKIHFWSTWNVQVSPCRQDPSARRLLHTRLGDLLFHNYNYLFYYHYRDYHHYYVVISFNNPSFQLELWRLFSIFPFQVREGEGVVLVCEVTFNIAFCLRTNIFWIDFFFKTKVHNCVNSRQRVIQRHSPSRGLLMGERWQVDLFLKFQSSVENPGPNWLNTRHSDMPSINRWIKLNHNPQWVWILQLLCDEMRQKDDIRNEKAVYLRQGRVGPFDVNIHDKLPPYIPTPLLPPLQPCWDCQNTIWFLFKTWICFQNNIWIRFSSKPG